jgi:hypothetical protein
VYAVVLSEGFCRRCYTGGCVSKDELKNSTQPALELTVQGIGYAPSRRRKRGRTDLPSIKELEKRKHHDEEEDDDWN